MSDYSDFPPYFSFISILKHYPEAAFAYKELWRYLFDSSDNVILKKDVRPIFGMAPTAFRNKLLMLKHEGIIDYKENTKSYKITIYANPNDDE